MDRLTPRERQVLQLIGQGKLSREIADELNVSVDTVANHRKSICQKLNLHSTAALVSFAARTFTERGSPDL